MAEIYMLWHQYWYIDDDGYEEDESKMLGLYTSETEAMEAANRYHKLPGFNKYPFDCFGVSKCMVDQDSAWVGGFFNPDVVIYYIIKKNIDLWNPEKQLPGAVDSVYDMEAKQIAKRIKINHTVEQLAEIIEQVCFEEFGWKHDTKYCIAIAEAIYKDLNEEFREK